MFGKVGNWVAGHRIALGLSWRIAAAGLLAFLAAQLVGLAQSYWAVLTAIIVMQASVGGSLKATIDRFVGTIAGAGWGVAVTLVVPHHGGASTALALVVALLPLGLLMALYPGYRVAPVTAAIVLLGPLGTKSAVLAAALDRLVEIVVGSLAALAVSMSIPASRAHRLLSAAARDALDPMGEQLRLLLGGVAAEIDAAAVLVLHDRIRGAIERAAAIATEAAHERASRLSDEPDPDPLVRTLRRLSHDLVMIARVLPMPLPEPARDRLAEPARRVGAGFADAFREIGGALVGRTLPPPLDAAAQTLAGFQSAIDGLRRDRLTTPLPTADAERIFGLSFALQQMRLNLTELANRTRELAGAAALPAA